MLRVAVLFAFVVVCNGHAVPLVAPAHHYPLLTGYAGHGYGGHGYGGYGYGGYGHGGLGHGGLGYGGLSHGAFGGLGHSGLGHAGLGLGGYSAHGHGLLGHGLLTKSVGHHILKRSPHLVAPLAHVAHVAPLAHVAPVAVSHQSRLDVHSSPAVVTSVVQPVVAPVLHAAPLLHKSFVAGPLHFGGGYGGFGGFGGHYGHGYGHY